MKVLQINPVYAVGSTGKIVQQLHDACVEQGMECRAAHRYVKPGEAVAPDTIAVSSKWDSRLHGQWSKYTMFKGAGSVLKTRQFLKRVEAYGPDLIHLHNLHGSYINLPLLFRYIKKNHIPVVWTLHDCWAFTAICSHFALAGCDKWQHGCGNCPQRRRFSSAPFDLSANVWKAKKTWFTDMSKATIVTPSVWLEELVRRSFLQDYPVRTIHNGIDLEIFRPTDSDFRAKHGLKDKKIVLGVAFDWGYSKGLDVFTALAERLETDYQIVLVGTNDQIDRELPQQILSIHRTHNQQELAAIYTAADVFVNPTREDTYPTVNMEAIACGTPVVTFRTGGSPESVDAACGVFVAQNDIEGLMEKISEICRQRSAAAERCVQFAAAFDKRHQIETYMELYRSMMS